ncbi:MAG TPA: L28 family ribosomal protein [Fimbriimonadaceae bacterium]|nr:L28 family ribosomal protein [Fimbriimonadaceae bacterium]
MARVCQVSGKKGNNAKHIRNTHSQGWKYKAPHKNRVQHPNLQTVRIKTPHGTVKLVVSTSVIKSPEFNAVVCGLKPMPKHWAKKASYGI